MGVHHRFLSTRQPTTLSLPRSDGQPGHFEIIVDFPSEQPVAAASTVATVPPEAVPVLGASARPDQSATEPQAVTASTVSVCA